MRIKILVGAALAAVFLRAGASAAPRARHRKEAPARVERRLLSGRWLDGNRDALERLVRRVGKDSPGYSAAEPPVAVFVLESTLADGAPGEAVFRRLVDKAAFKFDRAFWKLLPRHQGAERIRSGYNGFRDAPESVWEDEPHYRMYRKAFLRASDRLAAAEGQAVRARWRASLLAGFLETELRRFAREAVAEALEGAWGERTVGDSMDDPDPVVLTRGLRRIPETEALVRVLSEAGFDVWVMSLSDQWSAEAFLRPFGVHPSRVVGVRVKIEGGRLSSEALAPTPYKTGQIEALSSFIGRSPELVAGGEADEDLMAHCRGLRLLFVEPARAAAARDGHRDWLIQPAFPPVTAPQKGER